MEIFFIDNVPTFSKENAGKGEEIIKDSLKSL
jgi:hypothetical protein